MIKKYFIPVSLTITMLLAALVVWQWMSQPKVAYVSLNKIYSDFDLKKELEKKYTDIENIRQKTLDSMELGLNILSRNIQSMDKSKEATAYSDKIGEYQYRSQEYAYRKNQFGQDNENMSAQYTSQIWKQINQYVKEYGKEHGYTYIFGAADDGSLMYADAKNDITAEVTKYVNDRYRGLGSKPATPAAK